RLAAARHRRVPLPRDRRIARHAHGQRHGQPLACPAQDARGRHARAAEGGAMRCHEARKFLGPYLDSELDAKTSLEIEQHLEACPDCARVFAAEEKLDARIFGTLREGQRTQGLWDNVEARIKPRRFAWMAVAIPAAACVVAVAGFVWWKTHRLE